jgi:hypothetical protein
VTFVTTHGKLDYTEVKAYRPISLSSFVLQTMENLVDRHIRAVALREYPLYRNLHAYQIGKSTETTLHNVVTRTENAIEHKDIARSALLHIEGAFDRTSFNIIKQAAERHSIEPAVCRWICAMLESRNTSALLSGETLGRLRPEVFAGTCAVTSAVEPGRERSSLGTQQE